MSEKKRQRWSIYLWKILNWISTPLKPTVFISYAHSDVKEKDEILKNLLEIESYSEKGAIEWLNKNEINLMSKVWTDGEIEGGENYLEVIKENIKNSKIAILFLTDSFFTRDFISKIEMPLIFSRKRKFIPKFFSRKRKILPIIVKYCDTGEVKWITKRRMHILNLQSPLFDDNGTYNQESSNKVKEDLAKKLKSLIWSKMKIAIFIVIVFIVIIVSVLPTSIKGNVFFKNSGKQDGIPHVRIEVTGESGIHKWLYENVYNKYIFSSFASDTTDINGSFKIYAFFHRFQKKYIEIRCVYGKSEYEEFFNDQSIDFQIDKNFLIKNGKPSVWRCTRKLLSGSDEFELQIKSCPTISQECGEIITIKQVKPEIPVSFWGYNFNGGEYCYDYKQNEFWNKDKITVNSNSKEVSIEGEIDTIENKISVSVSVGKEGADQIKFTCE